jgi:hypothetical protein
MTVKKLYLLPTDQWEKIKDHLKNDGEVEQVEIPIVKRGEDSTAKKEENLKGEGEGEGKGKAAAAPLPPPPSPPLSAPEMNPPVQKKTKRSKADLWGPPGELMGMKVQRKQEENEEKAKTKLQQKTQEEEQSKKKKNKTTKKRNHKFQWINI